MAEPENLVDLETSWIILDGARPEQPTELRLVSRDKFFEKYSDPIKRYLRAALPGPDSVDDVFQEFALKFLKGDFRHADPSKGRFRDYLKSALFRLVSDYWRAAAKRSTAALSDPPGPPEHADNFDVHWRSKLVDNAFKALGEHDHRYRSNLFEVFRARLKMGDATWEEVARELERRSIRLTPEHAKKLMVKARVLLCQFLYKEVAATLRCPTRHAVEEEMIALDLHDAYKKYVRSVESRSGYPAAERI